MICPKCKHEVRSNIHICPYCGELVNVSKNNEQEKTIRTAKHVKSKIVDENQSSLVGGTVSKESFIKIKRKINKEKEILRKDYNNYIDYKEAKERALEEMSKPNSSKTRSILSSVVQKDNIQKSGTVSGRAVRKSNKTNNRNIKVVSKKNAINPIVSDAFGKKNSKDNKDNNIIKVSKTKSAIKIEKVDKKKNDKGYRVFNTLASMFVLILWVGTVYYLVTKPELSYYFYENNDYIKENNSQSNNTVDEEMAQYESVSKSGQVGGSTKDGVTSIVYDNQYLRQFTIKSESDIFRLISTDSIKQKDNCPANILQIENDIINNYGVTAVNLCEMDEDFALELKDVIAYIYNNYPRARNYLTNITLANVDEGSTFMAAFMPVFTFATSPGSSGYPAGIKTQILLNAKYFLDSNKIRNSVSYGSRSGYFPPNATRSSSVAHEFGHYLSYVAMLNSYHTERHVLVKYNQAELLSEIYSNFDEGRFSYALLNEAYDEYKREYPNDTFDEFRKSISNYAMAKDNKGNYIYDETIAEAFHDVFLNGDGAKVASKYIVNKLNEKL